MPRTAGQPFACGRSEPLGTQGPKKVFGNGVIWRFPRGPPKSSIFAILVGFLVGFSMKSTKSSYWGYPHCRNPLIFSKDGM